ncbi:MAG: hypothetical protein RML56_04200 [Burkholderiales bacterium]|nr:hypothetical protein [Burkholderiales bacterium]
MPTRIPPRAAFYALFTVSGFAGLIYESVWTHYLKLFLGHAAYAQSLVLAVFMGGMALGAAFAARRSTAIGNPLAAYALVEAAVGVAALGFHELFVAATDWAHEVLAPALGAPWMVFAAKLALSCALILPQSVLLGATFPLMSAGLARAHPAAAGESVAMLYFTNSLGAAAGVLASGFVLIEWMGLPGTLRTAGAINLALAAVVGLAARTARAAPLAPRPDGAAGAGTLLVAVAFFTGLASFVYEIAWIRMSHARARCFHPRLRADALDLHPRPCARRPGGAPARRCRAQDPRGACRRADRDGTCGACDASGPTTAASS